MTTWNKKQSELKELDQLTGLMKKNIVESKIAFKMNRMGGGALFLCDVDYLRWINEKYGHPAGDECLKQVAQILSYMVSPDDLLGRCGGDEFIVYMPGCRDEQQAGKICSRIEKRFRASSGGRNKIPFSVTMVWTLWQAGDTYRRAFERVSMELNRQKEALEIQEEQKDNEKEGYRKDVQKIRKELIEQIQKPGAYCRDYETFKGIYRFLERGIIRSGQKACVILITLVDEKGGSLLPHEKDVLMEELGEDIENTLRVGDVYTRYSSSQYLVLVIDTTEGQVGKIVDRIKNQFLVGRSGNNVLVHHCYELKPAQIGGKLE